MIGASAAFHLAEAGAEVVLLEAGELGAGSTTKSAGGFRLQFSDPINIELAKRSVAAFEEFGTRPGADIDLRQVGYLFLLDDPADVVEFERAVALQNSLDVPSRMLDVAEARALSPLIDTSGVLAATFCPRDGHCTPDAVVQGYAHAARARGARTVVRCAVSGLGSSADGWIVRTERGDVRTPIVVCAAGAWSRAVGRWADVDLPVEPVSRPVWFTEPMSGLPAQVPLTVDFGTGLYFHREGHGLLFGMADPDQPTGFDAPTRPDWLECVADVIARRAPSLLDVGVAGGWSGFYETTPDHNAIVGETLGSGGRFVVATGFSGHGFQLGPAIGEVLRDIVLGSTPAVDISGFALDRFTVGAARPERHIV